MIKRRTFLAAGAWLAAAGWALPASAAAEPAPAATLDAFYKVLLSVMKDGKKLGFAGRRERLAPAIRRAFDLPLMTRLVVGLQWASMTKVQQQQLIAAFSDYSIATYASQFNGYSGEKFVVDPKAFPAPANDVIVHTKLVQSDGKPVELDYLLRNIQGAWRIIDVYLSGTISQLAARRSEFSSVLNRSGVEGLVSLLKRKTTELSNG